MQQLLMMSALLVSITATAQQTPPDSVTSKLQADSLYKEFPRGGISPEQLADTTGDALLEQYGFRRYDPRMGRYIPPEPKRNAAVRKKSTIKPKSVKKQPN